MMRKILCTLLALMVLFAASATVFAAEDIAYVWDLSGKRDPQVIEELNKTANKLKNLYGATAAMVFIDGNAADAKPEDLIPADEEHYFLFVVGDTNNRFYTKGICDEIFADPDDRDRMGYVYDEMDLWQEAAARYFEVLEEYCKDLNDRRQESDPPSSANQISSSPTEATSQAAEKSTSPLPYLLAGGALIIIAASAIVFIGKKRAK